MLPTMHPNSVSSLGRASSSAGHCTWKEARMTELHLPRMRFTAWCCTAGTGGAGSLCRVCNETHGGCEGGGNGANT